MPASARLPALRRSRAARAAAFPFLAAALCVACGPASEPGTPSGGAAASLPATGPTGGRDTSAGAPRVRYDLAAHLARAELRQGEAQIIDFGVPGAQKYTLGGWRTRIGRDVREGQPEVSASVLENVTGFVLVPSDTAGPRTLRVRARAVADGRLTVYVGGETVGLATLPTDGRYATVRLELPEGRLEAGENSIQFRVPSTGALPSIPNAGVLIDWIRLGPEDDPHAEEAPPSPSQLVTGEGDGRVVRIPDGWSLGWTLDVPAGARLRGTARGPGRVEVTAHRDGAPPRTLGTLGGDAAFDLDLAGVGGELARIELRARGATSLVRPAVVTLDAPSVRPRSHPHHVLVYLTDTLRADKLRPYRPDTRVRTPQLDRWATQAALMVRGHAQENWTKPSVATLLSGLFPWEHQATSEEAVLPAGVDLLSERLGREGFHTGAFIANGFCSDRFGFRQGWSGGFRNYIREGLRTQAQFIAADVLDWLDRRPTDRPFFLYVHTVDPHVPYMPPAELLALYDPEPYAGPVDFHRDRELLEHVKGGSLRLNERDRLRLEALYDGEITYHDTHLGSILEGLERRGLADDTIVVFTADHGEEFWDHDSVGHGHSMYEELIHVPLLVRVPGVTEGAVPIEDVVGLVDVAPTLFDALGLELPEAFSGRSFLPELLGRSSDAPRYAVTGFMEGWRAVNVGRLKLIHRTERHLQLYDTAADPHETRDLAATRPIAVRYARGLLGLGLAEAESRGQVRVEVQPERATIDETTRQQLEALGYVGASRPQAPPEE